MCRACVLHAAPGAVIALYRSGTSGTPRIFKMMVILFKLLWMPQHPLESRIKKQLLDSCQDSSFDMMVNFQNLFWKNLLSTCVFRRCTCENSKALAPSTTVTRTIAQSSSKDGHGTPARGLWGRLDFYAHLTPSRLLEDQVSRYINSLFFWMSSNGHGSIGGCWTSG